MIHKAQPCLNQNGITEPWQPMSTEMLKGLKLAAYICRMYGDGAVWAETIESHGEQVRGRWWMEAERRAAVGKS